MPSHFRIHGKVPEMWVCSKATILVHHKMLHVRTNGDFVDTWSSKVSLTCGKECRESMCDVTLSLELIDGNILNLWPLYCSFCYFNLTIGNTLPYQYLFSFSLC